MVADLDDDDASYDDNSTMLDGDEIFFTDPIDDLQQKFGTGSPDDYLETDENGGKKAVREMTILYSNLDYRCR